MHRQRKPTHAAITRFLASILPVKENDVPRLYHVPRNPRYDPETAIVEQVVLSVTPTPGVYSLIGHQLNEVSVDMNTASPIPWRRPPRTTCFLHRPFTLDRRSVRRGTLVLSSHTSFDEILTVGWNTALAERLGLNVMDSICVKGYKGDPERKIGIIGQTSIARKALRSHIEEEFTGIEFAQDGQADEIHVVAIMNAFNEDEVHRVFEMVQQSKWILPDDTTPGKHILYLTGQPRASGLQAATALGMTVVCVGHRQAEDWGIRHIASSVRTAFPGLRVEEVYEEEVSGVKDKKKKDSTSRHENTITLEELRSN